MRLNTLLDYIKVDAVKELRYWREKLFIVNFKNSRYRTLLTMVEAKQPTTLVEVGTYNGFNARRIIERAGCFNALSKISYWGFDLFEDLTEEINAQEFSLMPPPKEEVDRFLSKTRADIHLIQGNSKKTIPQFVDSIISQGIAIDFIFLDGGHSYQTVQADWTNLEPIINTNTMVILDDYFVDPPKELEGFGCNNLIHTLKPSQYKTVPLLPTDHFNHQWGTLKTQLIQVIKI